MYKKKNPYVFLALLVVVTPITLLTGPTITLTDQYELESSGGMGDITYSVGNLPMGVKIEGNILSIEDRQQVQNGNYYIMVSAKDSSGNIISQLVNLVIEGSTEKNNLKRNTNNMVFSREAQAAQIVDNLNRQIQAENQKINQLKRETAQVQNSIANLKRSLNIDTIQTNLRRIENIMIGLNQQIKDFRMRKIQLEDSKRQAQKQKRGIQDQLKKIDQEIKQLSMNFNQDAKKRREISQGIDQQQRICEELQADYQDMIEQIRSKEIQKDRLGAQKRVVEEEIMRDKQKIQQLQRKLAEAKSQLEVDERQNLRIDLQRQTLNREITEIKNKLPEAADKIRRQCPGQSFVDLDYQEKMAQLEEQMKRLNRLLNNVNKRLSDIDKQMQDVEQAVKQRQLRINNLQFNARQLQQQARSFKQKVKQMQAQIDALIEETNKSQDKLRRLTIEQGHAYRKYLQFDKATKDALNQEQGNP